MADSGADVARIQNDYNRGDHQHPLQVNEQIPSRDTGTGVAGTSTAYSRADHQHILNTDPDVANQPQKDTGTWEDIGNFNYCARSNHAHPLNVDPTVAIVPLVIATAAANGMSDYYCRNEHVHPQLLAYDGNITATKFIKTGELATVILCVNGDTTNLNGIKSQNFPKDVGATAKYIKLYRFQAYNSYGDTTVEFKFYSRSSFNGLKLHISFDTTGFNSITYHYLQQINHASFRLPTILYYGSGENQYGELWMTVGDYQGNQGRIDLLTQIIYGSPVVSDMLTNQIIDTLPSDFTTKQDQQPNLQYNTETITNAPFQINPAYNTGYAYGLRIARSAAQGNSGIYLGTSATATTGTIVNQWKIYTSNANLGLKICLNADADNANRGLVISADGNTLTFKGSVIAGTGATNGSVNYSAGNPILSGVNSICTEGGFYSDGPKIYWRAKPITLGSVLT
ncbi:MAG: hypothetical protein EZS28_002608 [Streblomastix strix]|uniref:Uncharacterized protein n=1 Tax=Streblomastix strix TaxID=222440 RepID=A0A5J4X3L3_9EUKA|nr:MAG: hypothetical protein EZS28_002608 [Streblomastix strix]